MLDLLRAQPRLPQLGRASMLSQSANCRLPLSPGTFLPALGGDRDHAGVGHVAHQTGLRAGQLLTLAAPQMAPIVTPAVARDRE